NVNCACRRPAIEGDGGRSSSSKSTPVSQRRLTRKGSSASPSPHRSAASAPARFPIVAIAAMPSDLAALKRVFDRIESADIAVVVVSYAETDSKLIPPSGRRETLKRADARPGVFVEPRHCYVVHSERPVVLRNGHFEAVTRGRANRPISDLLVSLSEELGPKSVAVLLSGTSAEA